MTNDRDRCRCLGCTRQPLRHGLCNSHYGRFLKSKLGDVEKFLQDQRWSGPIAPRAARRGRTEKPADQATRTPRRGGRARRVAEDIAPEPGSNGHSQVSQAHDGFQDVVLPEGVKRVRVGRIGSFVTLTDFAGRVLHQMNA